MENIELMVLLVKQEHPSFLRRRFKLLVTVIKGLQDVIEQFIEHFNLDPLGDGCTSLPAEVPV